MVAYGMFTMKPAKKNGLLKNYQQLRMAGHTGGEKFSRMDTLRFMGSSANIQPDMARWLI